MARRSKIIPDFNIERERFSNFVVDLRQKEKKAVQEARPEIKIVEKKIKKNWDANLNKLSRNFNIFKPNLLLDFRKQGVRFSWPQRRRLTDRRKTGFFGMRTSHYFASDTYQNGIKRHTGPLYEQFGGLK